MAKPSQRGHIDTVKGTFFHQNLPKKICVDCGEQIEEQHESYLFKCERCLRHEE